MSSLFSLCYCRLLHQHFLPPVAATCQQIHFNFYQTVLSQANTSSHDELTVTHTNLDLPAHSNAFQWNFEETSSVEDISPIFFRPTLPASPIGPELDEARAIVGKACARTHMHTHTHSFNFPPYFPLSSLFPIHVFMVLCAHVKSI